MRFTWALLAIVAAGSLRAQIPPSFPGTEPQDRRTGELRNLNSYFPFKHVDTLEQWKQRQREIRRRILVSQGLWPLPRKQPLNAVVHGRVERDDYVVDRVYFESFPGHFVTGSLYRPKSGSAAMPAILSPHGHWNNGRFYDAGEQEISSQLKNGAEQFEVGGRYPIQARAVQLARMGCLVFVYDMTGYADSIQIKHRPANWSHLDTDQNWGFMSLQAELRLQNMMGLQTWNSIRAIDFMLTLDQTDPDRIGVTGASGGGTQSMIISAIDDRIAASMPCVMVSTAMQGGCTCENAPLLRVDQGNIDIAAATAPRPLGLTAADDWTVELESKGYPDLLDLYQALGQPSNLTAVFHTQFKHNYNAVNRAAMYSFFNRHFRLGLEEPIIERDYQPLSRDEATVWTEDHPAPSGDQAGDAHEVGLLRLVTSYSDRLIQDLVPTSPATLPEYRTVIGGAWETIIGRRLDQVRSVAFNETTRIDGDVAVVRVGHIDHVGRGEQLPVVRIEPTIGSVGTVIWVSDNGKASLHSSGRLIEPAQKLVDAGYRIVAADLFGQGEFLEDGQPITAQPMWHQGDGSQGWHRFGGYTYGYNHSLFAKRVHDVLTLVKHAQSAGANVIHLIGVGSVAGPVAAAARSQAGDAIGRTLIGLNGFRFSAIRSQNDPMFLPGSVKYLDVDGVVSLCAPAQVVVLGDQEPVIAKAVYAAAGAGGRLQHDPRSDVAASIEDLVSNR